MFPKLFPSSITKFSTESLIKKHSTKSQIIYWLLIFTVIAFFTAMFWIDIDVNVQSSGLITSREKTYKITAPVFGRVITFSLNENSQIKQGDTLFVIDTTEIKKNIAIINGKKEQLKQQISDLSILVSLKKAAYYKVKDLNTPLYKQEYKKLVSDFKFQKSQIAILRKEYLREKQLFDKEVIPPTELEQAAYKYENSKLQLDKIFDNQLASWQSRLNSNNNILYDINEKLNQLNKELRKHFVTAPINGYILNLIGVKKGSTVYPNQEICTISPSARLIVETYVSTSDIGLIHTNQNVKFRVDAFNHNQWGMLKGKVIEIAKDINVSEKGIPSFKIRCSLNDTHLTYRDKTVSVKKGMTLNANFILTRRTLAQLLYDKITDWLDPNETKQIEN